MNDLIEHALRDADDNDMVGMAIQNQVNQNDKPIGNSFRWKYQLTAEVIWSVFEKVSHSNSRLNALFTLVVTVHLAKMPFGFCKHAIKSRGWTALRNDAPQEKYLGDAGRGKLPGT